MRVAKKYLKVIPKPNQTSVGLKNRWATLQDAINKFSGCVQQITYANQSGTTNKDQLTYALRLYAKNHKKSFTHLNCYNILVNAPKWNEYVLGLEQKQKSKSNKQKIPPSSSDGHHFLSQSAQAASSDPGDSIDPLSKPTTNANSTLNKIKHPAGNKHAKLDQQDGAWQRSLAKSQQMMAEQTEKQNEILQTQTEAMKSLAKDSRLASEDKILSKDTSQMDDHTKRYYEMKNKIYTQYNIE